MVGTVISSDKIKNLMEIENPERELETLYEKQRYRNSDS